MTYRQLIENPSDGLYKSAKGWLLIDKARIVHSPLGATFRDNEEFERVENKEE